jgi:hypothetical protein
MTRPVKTIVADARASAVDGAGAHEHAAARGSKLQSEPSNNAPRIALPSPARLVIQRNYLLSS